ncbi:hypothetical protein HYE67_007968 [Fusarium culmorum]|uniref:Beta-lactamase-related domain-containing protein n=1 Tax=Fusarium culmorum TaxID=5516 RepID=A0A7S8DBW1_FUSCU|nr:hypothetical protein HYE67_007968 [Fusarium culmorum]
MTRIPTANASSVKRSWQENYRLAEPLIRQACTVSGTPGLAIGIFNHEGKIFDKYLGHRDVHQKLGPDPETVFNIGSMCKGFTAVAVACLVADGKLHWDDRIEKFIDELHGTNIGCSTIRDLLSHRTGLSRSDALFIGSDNQLLLSKAQGTSLLASLDKSRPPRQDFIYNNFGYHAVGCVIEKLSSVTYGDFLVTRIFKPLEMTRTFTTLPPAEDKNVSLAYMPYHNLELRQVPSPLISSDTVAFSAGGIRSCTLDLVTFYSSLLSGFSTCKKLHNLKLHHHNLRAIFEAAMPLTVDASLREQSYALGWVRTQLPNQVSEITGNSGLLEDYPRLGSYENGPLLFHHAGNNIGCSSSIYLMPELDVGIVVLGNSLGHCDATGWACQILTETHLNHNTKIDFSTFVSAAASKGRSAMNRVQDALEREREPSELPRDPSVYTGVFWHTSRQFCIQVLLDENGELAMLLQGRDSEKYTLRHYNRHTFVFNETFNQIVDRGQWCRPYWFYKISFAWHDDDIVALKWRIDDTQEEEHVFDKLGSDASGSMINTL